MNERVFFQEDQSETIITAQARSGIRSPGMELGLARGYEVAESASRCKSISYPAVQRYVLSNVHNLFEEVLVRWISTAATVASYENMGLITSWGLARL